nr:MFS transporter [Streptomyces alboflavus]
MLGEQDRAVDHAGLLVRQGHDQHVHVAVAQPREAVGDLQLPGLDPGARVALCVQLGGADRELSDGGADVADAQHVRDVPGGVDRLPQAGLEGAVGRQQVVVQPLSRRSEADVAAGALEQGRPDAAFHLADGLADPTGRQTQAVGGAAEMQLATFLLVSGHFAAFTFISPVLQEVSGIDESLVGPLLLGFGVAGIAGNFLAGTAAARDVRATLVTISVALTAILAVFPLAGGTPVGGTILLIAWGLAFGGVPVGVQTWILKSAPDSTEAATALNTSVFNLAIALGALVGGIVADQVTLTGVLLTGALLAVPTTLAVWSARRAGRSDG